MKKITLLVIALFILAACAGSNSTITGDWKLISYGNPSNPTTAISNIDTNIKFDSKGNMSGNVGCNGFGGTYEQKEDTLSFSAIMSTMMFCDETMLQEQGVLSVFSDGVTLQIQLSGDILTITSADGASVVNLARK